MSWPSHHHPLSLSQIAGICGLLLDDEHMHSLMLSHQDFRGIKGKKKGKRQKVIANITNLIATLTCQKYLTYMARFLSNF